MDRPRQPHEVVSSLRHPQPQPQPQPHSSVDDNWKHQLRRYLLLLASLAATVTYAAGLDPPGGSWVESDGEKMAVAGDSILRATNHGRYLAFYYANATAFAASLVVILLLLVSTNRNRSLETIRIRVLRLVMVLDLFALMAAYTAGSCREKVATIYTVALVTALLAYVGFHILVALHDKVVNVNGARQDANGYSPELEQLRKVLMLLAIFAATITYDAGLKPPGGFWEHTNGGLHRAGDVILKHKHGGRFAVFFFCNTTAFIASLFTVVLLLDKKLTASATWRLRVRALYGFVVVTMVALVAAYAAGSCRKTATTTYTVALVAPVLVSIFLAAAADYTRQWFLNCLRGVRGPFHQLSHNRDEPDESLKEKRSLVLLLGTLAASITYQAGLNPPGGVWLENQSGHNAGDPILLNTDNKRYSIFFYCNSTAFVASIVVILMVQNKALLKRNALHTAIMFDLVGLMGAYIAGSSRTLRASLYVIVLAAAFLVYVMGTYLHVKFTKSVDPPQPQINDAAAGRTSLKKRRKRLLLFAILMAAITYQAGLRPPGGFWPVEQGQGHSSPGSPILEGMYPRRYRAFFYCNAMSFMASIALIILLQDDKTYQAAGIRFYGLYACMLVGMLVLMGAYAAGSARRVRTSIYVFVLVGGVSVFIAVLLALFVLIRRQEHQGASSSTPTPTTLAPGGRQSSNANGNGGSTAGNNNDDDNHQDRQSSNAAYAGGTAENDDDDNHRRQGEGGHAKRKYVMLLAMLAASVTYQAGLDPPGGVWPEGYAAGSPVLHDSNLRRYHVFFYSNSSSFVASIVVIILLLQSELRNMPSRHGRQQHNVQRIDEPRDNPLLLMATNTVVALDLVGLLVAYAAGSSRTMDTSLYVIVLVVAVVIYIVVHVRLPDAVNPGPGEGTSNTQGASGERRNGANGQHEQADALSP